MAYFPFYMDIENKNCIVFGGGNVALRKIEKLLPFGCNITAVSPYFVAEIENINNVTLVRDKFNPRYLADAFFVIAATCDAMVNSQISALCREKNIPVNVVDVKEECSFIFPALYKSKDICVGISTGGKSPQAAKVLRQKIEAAIPPCYADITQRLGALRASVKNELPTQKEREKMFDQIFKALLDSQNTITDGEIEDIIKGYTNEH